MFDIKRQKYEKKNDSDKDIVLETFSAIEEARLGLEKYYPNRGKTIYIHYSKEALKLIQR